MAQITEDDKKELKVLTEELLDISQELRDLRKHVMIRLILSYLYEFIWCGMVLYSLYVNLVETYPIYFCIVNVILYVIIAFYYEFLVKLPLRNYEKKYKMGVLKLSSLVNFVDWEVYRKRQLYNATNPNVDRSISSFLILTRAMISPTNEKNKFFKVLLILSVVFGYTLLTIVLYLCIVQWV